MKYLLLILLLTCAGYAQAPFQYDPNQCPSGVMDCAIADPNISLIYALYVHNPGLDVDIEVVNLTDPNDYIVIDFIGGVAADDGYNRYWQFGFTPQPVERVNYLQVTATDVRGRSASRMVLVYAVCDGVPEIYPVKGEIPISRVKQSQKLWQVAAKKGVQLTKPTSIWN